MSGKIKIFFKIKGLPQEPLHLYYACLYSFFFFFFIFHAESKYVNKNLNFENFWKSFKKNYFGRLHLTFAQRWVKIEMTWVRIIWHWKSDCKWAWDTWPPEWQIDRLQWWFVTGLMACIDQTSSYFLTCLMKTSPDYHLKLLYLLLFAPPVLRYSISLLIFWPDVFIL